jgi:hypothetical protein
MLLLSAFLGMVAGLISYISPVYDIATIVAGAIIIVFVGNKILPKGESNGTQSKSTERIN